MTRILALLLALAVAASPARAQEPVSGGGSKPLVKYGKWLLANTRPEDARFGTTSLNTLIHLFGLMIGQALNRPLEAVYYKGASPLVSVISESKALISESAFKRAALSFRMR